MSRWLWLTPEIAGTLSTGALLYSHETIRAMGREGIDVEVVGLSTDGPAPARTDGVVFKPVPGRLRPPWRSVVSSLPNQAAACALPQLRRAITEAVVDTPWDAIVVDGLRMAWVQPLLDQERPTTVVFFTHNHETSMRRSIADGVSKRTVRWPLLELEARKTRRLEHRMLASADVVTAITESDRRRFETDAPSATHVLVSPGWSGQRPSAPTSLAERPRRVGILGSYQWHVKQESLRRFVSAAAPVFEEHGIQLWIGGRMDESFRQEIDAYEFVTLLGWVDDPVDFLDNCRIGVVAESLGGGFKLKALDYVFNGIPLAVLRASAAGLPFRHGVSMMEADTEAALAVTIADMIDDTVDLARIAENALAIAEPQFAWSASARALDRAVAERG